MDFLKGGESFETNDGTADGRPVPRRCPGGAGGRHGEEDVLGMRQADRAKPHRQTEEVLLVSSEYSSKLSSMAFACLPTWCLPYICSHVLLIYQYLPDLCPCPSCILAFFS